MQVKTTDGILEGELVTNDVFETKYYSFKGIPYAAPPVGKLRFKAPQPPKPWEGVRSAISHGCICHQYDFITRLIKEGSEDCLFLNIYTPDIKPAKPLPVMIWIHGGAFCCGSGNEDLYGPEFLIQHDVILVTFNFRLEVLGFLCLDIEEAPGNAGIKDQVAAIRWVNKNISNFGGDPNNVTLFGQSSGGVSVSYHCVSPTTKGLFKRAIVQSGCINNWIGQFYRPVDRAIALARKLGFESEDPRELYDFFLEQPVKNLLFAQVSLTHAETQRDKNETQFTVVSEKVFPNEETYFTGDITEALKNNIHEGLELIIGYNEDDGVINLNVIFDIEQTISQANSMKEFFVPKPLSLYCSIDDQLDIGKKMRDYYLKKNPLTINNLQPLVKYYSFEMYVFGLAQFAKYFSIKNKVYFYKFTCKTERNFFSKIMGITGYFPGRQLVGHSDELPYLFPINSVKQNISKNSETFKLINRITKLWTHFAKTGNPTPDTSLGANWKPYRSTAPFYLNIGNTMVRSCGADKEELQFWESVFKQYLPSRMYIKEEKP